MLVSSAFYTPGRDSRWRGLVNLESPSLLSFILTVGRRGGGVHPCTVGDLSCDRQAKGGLGACGGRGGAARQERGSFCRMLLRAAGAIGGQPLGLVL